MLLSQTVQNHSLRIYKEKHTTPLIFRMKQIKNTDDQLRQQYCMLKVNRNVCLTHKSVQTLQKSPSMILKPSGKKDMLPTV